MSSAPSEAAAASRAGGMAFKSLYAIVLFVVVAVAGTAADLASKKYIFESLLNEPAARSQIQALAAAYGDVQIPGKTMLHSIRAQRRVMPGMQFTLSTNPGVVFGLAMPRTAVAVATILTIVLVLFFFATSQRRAWMVHLSLACILSGALGNLYDRLLNVITLGPKNVLPISYEVRDFIDCSEIGYRYIFNVADVLLVVGVGLMLLHWFLARPKKAAAN